MSSESPTQIVKSPISGDKTVVVLGAFRGGTSMITSALDALGIPMGFSPSESDTANGYPNWEDKEFHPILFTGVAGWPCSK